MHCPHCGKEKLKEYTPKVSPNIRGIFEHTQYKCDSCGYVHIIICVGDHIKIFDDEKVI